MADRGIIRKITFEISYPNGETKVVSLEEELENISSIVFSDALVCEKDKKVWGDHKDWRENPAMLLIDDDDVSTPYCRWKWHLKNG